MNEDKHANEYTSDDTLLTFKSHELGWAVAQALHRHFRSERGERDYNFVLHDSAKDGVFITVDCVDGGDDRISDLDWGRMFGYGSAVRDTLQPYLRS